MLDKLKRGWLIILITIILSCMVAVISYPCTGTVAISSYFFRVYISIILLSTCAFDVTTDPVLMSIFIYFSLFRGTSRRHITHN